MKKTIAFILLSVLWACLCRAQPSDNKNYVYSVTYMKPFVAVPQGLSLEDGIRQVRYTDGFGRPVQEIAICAADGQKDLVQMHRYDNAGRENYSHLPYATHTQGSGGFKPNAQQGQLAYYADAPPQGQQQNTYPYGRNVYEGSMAGLLIEQGYPGQDWQTRPFGRSSLSEYRHTNNTLGTDQPHATRMAVRYSAVKQGDSLVLLRTGIHPIGELYVSVTKDENWTDAYGRTGTVETYTDKEGRLVLKRTFIGNAGGTLQLLSTYYVYDDFGNLVFVLPPATHPDGGTLPSAELLEDFGYRYVYDAWDRLVERKVPGRAVEYLAYDDNDQLVATQDGNLRQQGLWHFTKYDHLGRAVITGLWDNQGTAIGRTALQLLLDQGPQALHVGETRTATGYSNLAWPTSGVRDTLMLHYYDSYDIPGLPEPYDRRSLYSKKTTGLPTASRLRILEADSAAARMLWAVTYYDGHGRPARQYGQHYLGGAAAHSVHNRHETDYSYSFAGLPLQVEQRQYTAQDTTVPALRVRTYYTYDHLGRLVELHKQLDEGTPLLLARYSYNEVGQLARKQLHSEWGGDVPEQLMLGADDGVSEGQQVAVGASGSITLGDGFHAQAGSTFHAGITAGGFAETITYSYNARGWMTAAQAGLFSQTLGYQDGEQPLYNGMVSEQQWARQGGGGDRYRYDYDKAYRLRSGLSDAGRQESVSYDAMGNILSMMREDSISVAYTYQQGRLHRLSGAGSYSYDANGNTLHDGRTGVGMAYSYLDQPLRLTGAVQVDHVYDATGRRLRTVNHGTGQARDYLGTAEWVDGLPELVHTEEGRAVSTGTGYVHEYFLADHLGNTRAVFRVLAGGGKEEVQWADYYPFGLAYRGLVPSPDNRYLYNGKELQDGTGQYDYHARVYDPVIGRFGSVDPLAAAYDAVTPYAYVGNSPLNYTDPTGMAWQDWIKPKYGKPFWDANINGQADFLNSKYAFEDGYEWLGGDDYTFPGGIFREVVVTAEAPTWMKTEAMAFSTVLEERKYKYRLGAGNFFTGEYPDRVMYEAVAVFHRRYVQQSEIYFNGKPTGSGALVPSYIEFDIALAVATLGQGNLARAGVSEVVGNTVAAKGGWKVGQPITNLTAKGNLPVWSTVRQRFWKNEAFLNGSTYEKFNVLRMQKGLAPQFQNVKTGVMESMELHHIIPQRSGGLFEFIKVTPEQHRLIDPFRR